jgi:hypothetical protein
MRNKLRTYKKIRFIGYLAGVAAIANFIDQHMPLLTGDTYAFDHGANLANAATILVSVVAILTSNALEEVELKIKDATKIDSNPAAPTPVTPPTPPSGSSQ